MQSKDRSTRQFPDVPVDTVSLAEHRQVESRGEEILQLSFTVHQDLLELEHLISASAAPALRSAKACNAAVVTLCQHLLADRRARIAMLVREAGEPVGELAARAAWSLPEAWIIVDANDEVLGVSDDACAIVAHPRGDVVGHRFSDLLGLPAADVDALLAAAERVGTASAGVHVVTPRIDRHLRLELHRLPGTRDGRATFVALLSAATNPSTDVSASTGDPRASGDGSTEAA